MQWAGLVYLIRKWAELVLPIIQWAWPLCLSIQWAGLVHLSLQWAWFVYLSLQWAGLVYLSEADISGQQQEEQRAVVQLREEQHEAADRTAGRCRRHQTETREARDINDHMTVCHLTRID